MWSVTSSGLTVIIAEKIQRGHKVFQSATTPCGSQTLVFKLRKPLEVLSQHKHLCGARPSEVVGRWVWGGARDRAFPTGSRAILKLLDWGPPTLRWAGVRPDVWQICSNAHGSRAKKGAQFKGEGRGPERLKRGQNRPEPGFCVCLSLSCGTWLLGSRGEPGLGVQDTTGRAVPRAGQ